MGDVQILTINLSRGDERLQETLESRRNEYRRLRTRAGVSAIAAGYRITAIPVTADVSIDRVQQHADLFEFPNSVPVHLSQISKSFPGFFPATASTSAIRPQLRGAWRERTAAHLTRRITVLASGLVEIGYKLTDKDFFGVWVDDLVYDLANVLEILDKTRIVGEVPGTEYALDVELRTARDFPGKAIDDQGAISVALLQDDQRPSCQIEPGPLRLPLISVGGRETFQGIVSRVLTDIYNACGNAEPEPLTVDEFSAGPPTT